MTGPQATSVEFWFDPGCRFTWRTSRWLVDVAHRRARAPI
jgi:membrane-associated PAP2 superfamily phosphatase